MHGTNCQVVTEVGRLRENVRGRVTITVDAVDLVTITYYTPTHVESAVLSGEHWDEYVKAINTTDRAVKRARLKTVKAVRTA